MVYPLVLMSNHHCHSSTWLTSSSTTEGKRQSVWKLGVLKARDMDDFQPCRERQHKFLPVQRRKTLLQGTWTCRYSTWPVACTELSKEGEGTANMFPLWIAEAKSSRNVWQCLHCLVWPCHLLCSLLFFFLVRCCVGGIYIIIYYYYPLFWTFHIYYYG